MANRRFSRKPGEVGVHIDFEDVSPSDKNKYHSDRYMHDVYNEKLFKELSKIPLHTVKGAFEKKNLLHGVIFHRWEKISDAGVVLVAFAESGSAAKSLLKAKDDSETTVIQSLSTKKLLDAIDAKSMKLRARVWQDEVDACYKEHDGMKVQPVPLMNLENDKGELREIRKYQRDVLSNLIQTVRDQCGKMQENFGPMSITIKQIIPMGLVAFKNLNEFNVYYKKAVGEKPKQAPPFKVYFATRDIIVETIREIHVNVCHRLAQVHSSAETSNQQKLKQLMKSELREAAKRLEPDYDWTTFKHPDWQHRIVNRDHGLFLGLASVVTAGMNTIIEVDQQVDEYFSGISSGVKIEI